MKSRLHYLASEYFATGEGMTVCLLITYAFPRREDYKKAPKFDIETKEYFEGELWYSQEQIAENEFRKEFGGFYSMGVEHFSKDEFFKRFAGYIPHHVAEMHETDKVSAGNFVWMSSFHLNMS